MGGFKSLKTYICKLLVLLYRYLKTTSPMKDR